MRLDSFQKLLPEESLSTNRPISLANVPNAFWERWEMTIISREACEGFRNFQGETRGNYFIQDLLLEIY